MLSVFICLVHSKPDMLKTSTSRQMQKQHHTILPHVFVFFKLMIKKQTNKNTKCSFNPDTVPDPFFWKKGAVGNI